MNDWQKKVTEFNRAIGVSEPKTIEIRDAELRARLILEEACETAEALIGSERAYDLISERAATQRSRADQFGPWLPAAIDGICDLIYVAVGAADVLGFDLDPFFAEVHRANMTKLGGPKDPITGKQLKPPGWKAPDIEGLLEQERKKGR